MLILLQWPQLNVILSDGVAGAVFMSPIEIDSQWAYYGPEAWPAPASPVGQWDPRNQETEHTGRIKVKQHAPTKESMKSKILH